MEIPNHRYLPQKLILPKKAPWSFWSEGLKEQSCLGGQLKAMSTKKIEPNP